MGIGIGDAASFVDPSGQYVHGLASMFSACAQTADILAAHAASLLRNSLHQNLCSFTQSSFVVVESEMLGMRRKETGIICGYNSHA